MCPLLSTHQRTQPSDVRLPQHPDAVLVAHATSSVQVSVRAAPARHPLARWTARSWLSVRRHVCACCVYRCVRRDVLFGGCGFVPQVPMIQVCGAVRCAKSHFALPLGVVLRAWFGASERTQAWIERAWKRGFDAEGASQLGWRLVGSTKWIGAGECVALLRSFGASCAGRPPPLSPC